MMSRPHPSLGWLYVKRTEWGQIVGRLLEERDRTGDPSFSGQPPAFLDWVRSEMPALAARYPVQFEQRIADLRHLLNQRMADVERGRLDLKSEVDRLQDEINQLQNYLIESQFTSC